jgi:actin-like ATPase involved in cell morphogenesis
VTYVLGVDLGTTYTAAAIHRDGRTSTVDLGTRTAAIPSVVFLRDDGTFLTGDAASRRGASEPGRVAREFKRRVGDTTPILLGGSPVSADALMAQLLGWVVGAVTEREGAAPDRTAVTHPANWGPYKQDLLRQAIARADLDHTMTITEPEAAVTYYASQERVEPGAVIAVYDLGGGTFDAAVVRKTASGVELLGSPEGIERLGGIDFDEAVFSHVAAALGGALDQLDPSDPAALAAVARLRSECVEAKEALSADTEVAIPVLLPNVATEVRLTRAELEAMIRPSLADSITAMRRALRSAGVAPEDLSAVLLAGGSSRIPLVAQMVGAELGRPVAVDAHPKHGVALGAALAAAGGATAAGGPVTAAGVMPPPPPSAPSGAATPQAAVPPPPDPIPTAPLGAAAAAAATTVAAATSAAGPPGAPAPAPPTEPLATTPPPPPPAPPAHAAPAPPAPPASAPPTVSAAPGPTPASSYTPPPPPRKRGRQVALVAGVLVAGALVAGGILALSNRDDGNAGATDTTGAPNETTVATTAGAVTTAAVATTATPATTAATTAVTVAPPACPEGDTRECIDITNVAIDGDSLVIDWTPFNFEPSIGDRHAHFFYDTVLPTEAGTNAAQFGATPKIWELTDARPFRSEREMLLSNKPPEATQVCVTVANAEHGVVDPTVFECVPLPL